jgi:hypothetical protein
MISVPGIPESHIPTSLEDQPETAPTLATMTQPLVETPQVVVEEEPPISGGVDHKLLKELIDATKEKSFVADVTKADIQQIVKLIVEEKVVSKLDNLENEVKNLTFLLTFLQDTVSALTRGESVPKTKKTRKKKGEEAVPDKTMFEAGVLFPDFVKGTIDATEEGKLLLGDLIPKLLKEGYVTATPEVPYNQIAEYVAGALKNAGFAVVSLGDGTDEVSYT